MIKISGLTSNTCLLVPGRKPHSGGKGIAIGPGGGTVVVDVGICCTGGNTGSAVGIPTATSAGILTLGTEYTVTSSSSSSHSHKPSDIRHVRDTSITLTMSALAEVPVW